MTSALDRLARLAHDAPDRLAVVAAGRKRGTYRGFSYRDLVERTAALSAGFRRLGMSDGRRVALLVPPGRGLFEAGYGLMRAGACPVLVDPGIGLGAVGACLEQSAVSAVVATPEALAARRVMGWVPTADRVSTSRWSRRVPHLDALAVPVADEGWAAANPAGIAFTSGSTGPAKGVVLTHEMLAAQVDMIEALYEIQPGTMNLATFAPFALFGPMLGMTTLLPHMDFTRPGRVDPTRLIEMASAFGADMMFGSPAVLDRLGRYGAVSGERLPTIRTVLSAGAPVRRDVRDRMARMLDPDAIIATPYGATEALPVASITHRELEGLDATGICVGRPVDGIDVTLIPVTDSTVSSVEEIGSVPMGEIGEIVVRGPNVTPGYDARPDADAAATITWDGRRAHRMGDLGSFDESGRLWFAGRLSHRLVCSDRILATVPLEAVFDEHPAVARSALVGVDEGDGVRPLVCVELEPGTRWTTDLRDDLLLAARSHRDAARTGADRVVDVLVHDGFPTDVRHNSKIDRPALGRWASARLRADR